ncbi:MAG TPA: cytochrome c oxidase assembly protein [Stellaceae bacterium]|nr:cytochrome c oxidase assembly protein [Stellaceae bacterium]
MYRFSASGGAARVYLGIAAVGAGADWMSRTHPALLPAWAPWDFSWVEYIATALTLWWFARGMARAAPEDRLAWWRCGFFLAGIAALWIVLETRYEYLALHMFFLNRIQHVVMHHLGPFLIALGGAGATIRRGMPAPFARLVASRAMARLMDVVQQPVIAAVLFVGTFFFWLIPAVHFHAMIDPRIYNLMNWTMVVDGLLFWSLVLDRRPQPPARVSYGVRVALAVCVMFPQIGLGAFVTFATRDLYPYYDLCGRLYPSISAITDQHIGGIVIWIPPAMMSVVAVLLALNALRLHEEAVEKETGLSPIAIAARSWTGR